MTSALQATFINRESKAEYTPPLLPSNLTFNSDLRTFTGSFDIEVFFPRDQKIDLRSHDFVEFWYLIDNVKFQVGVGYLETFKMHAAADSYKVQANGRDLLGQLITIPFREQQKWPQLSLSQFIPKALSNDSYVYSYLDIRNRSNRVIDRGAYKPGMLISSTAMINRAAVIEEYADLAMNKVYLDRLGRVTIYGRDNVNDLQINQTISHEGDPNVVSLVKTDDYTKVYSQVTIFVADGESNLDLAKIPSPTYINTDARVAHVWQPYYKTLSSADLVKLAGINTQTLQNRMAKSIVRQSNQNIGGVVIQASQPFYLDSKGTKTPFEIGQNWNVKSDSFGFNKQMKLVQISMHQEAAALDVQLGFVEPDTVV